MWCCFSFRRFTKGLWRLDLGSSSCVEDISIPLAVSKQTIYFRKKIVLTKKKEKKKKKCCILTSDPARLSDEKCTSVNNKCIRSKISGGTLTVDGLNWVWIVTLARSRWTSNYYMTPETGSSEQLERRCWNENHAPAEAGLPGPRLSSPWERERNAAVARRVGGGQYVAVLFSLQLTSHR